MKFQKAALAAGMLFGLSGAAQALLVDDFSFSQAALTVDGNVGDLTNPIWASSQAGPSAATIITGYRDLWIGYDNNAGSTNGVSAVGVNVLGYIELSLQNGPSARSAIQLDWDGGLTTGDPLGPPTGIVDDNTPPPPDAGTGPEPLAPNTGAASTFDLTDAGTTTGPGAGTGTADHFVFEALFSDAAFDYQIIVRSAGGAVSVFTGSAPQFNTPQIVAIPFASFVGNANFAAATSTTLYVSTPEDAADFTLDRLYTSGVPEPTSLALMGLGLFGMGGLARRRMKKA